MNVDINILRSKKATYLSNNIHQKKPLQESITVKPLFYL